MRKAKVGDWIRLIAYHQGYAPGDVFVITELHTCGHDSLTARFSTTSFHVIYSDSDAEGTVWQHLAPAANPGPPPICTPTLPKGINAADYYKAGYGKDSEDTYKELKWCSHVWKEYNSGWSKYEYCEKCDIKREEAKDTPKQEEFPGDFWITGVTRKP